MNIVPYIGITDFTDFRQVQNMLEVFRKNVSPESNRRLHVGVMMSRKTLKSARTPWSTVFPPKEDIRSIFESGACYNCLHYVDYESEASLWEDLLLALSYGGIGIHAIQLDMIWPEASHIADAIHNARKHVEVILQIGQRAFEEIGNNPESLAERLDGYDGVINRVLLDRSMGKGIPLDAESLLPFARVIKSCFPNMGIGVAGGLGPDTVHLVKPLLKEFPDISIDAQGKLRPSGNAMDPVDWNIAEKYLARALKLFKDK